MRPFPIANLWITCGLSCVFPVDWVHLLLCPKSFCFGGENSETALFECLKDVNAVQSSLSRRSEGGLELHAARRFKGNAELGELVLEFCIRLAVSDTTMWSTRRMVEPSSPSQLTRTEWLSICSTLASSKMFTPCMRSHWTS